MNNSKIIEHFTHDYFENAIIAMINDMSLWFGSVNIPVFVLNTGDEVFIIDQNKLKKLDSLGETLYQKTPRIVLDINDIDFQTDEMTSPHQKGKFKLNMDEGTREFRTKVQRIPCTVSIGFELFTDNILMALKYSELMLMILTKKNTFEFKYLQKTYTSTYNFDFSIKDERNIIMSQDSNRRSRVLSTNISLQLQYPNFNLFVKKAGVYMPNDNGASRPPDGSFGNGIDAGDPSGGGDNDHLIESPDLEDITDDKARTKWYHHIIDKNDTFETKTTYDGTVENPIPNHEVIKPK